MQEVACWKQKEAVCQQTIQEQQTRMRVDAQATSLLEDRIREYQEKVGLLSTEVQRLNQLLRCKFIVRVFNY